MNIEANHFENKGYTHHNFTFKSVGILQFDILICGRKKGDDRRGDGDDVYNSRFVGYLL